MHASIDSKTLRKLDALYERYGFEVRTQYPGIRVYVFSSGYFHNAEIIPFNEIANYEKIQRDLTEMGYACKVRHYAGYGEIEKELFKGFFAVESTAQRLLNDYEKFSAAQSKNLGGVYQYVLCPFVSENDERQDLDIVTYIRDLLTADGPHLVVLEAAAGFGKTCTAYEVLHALIANKSCNPIFTELSRNRQARAFRYVLLDEIDRNYSFLKLKLVIDEIQNGRLPLIIDGFDELLYRGNETQDQTFEDAESMLDTIGDLLKNQSKVLLTTRKTAIFDGDEFHKWMAERVNQFEVTRIVLLEPTLSAWLGATKLDRLKEVNVPVADFANPVILTYLRNLPDEIFESTSISAEIIAEKYFVSLLEREQERQKLRIDPSTQQEIFKNIAKMMIDLDISSAPRELIKEFILETAKDYLIKARRNYSPSERPTLDQLADTLSVHALLDRVGRRENSVGFVNDFVFGSLIADVVLEEKTDEWIGKEYVVDLAATAYRIRSEERRFALWKKIFFTTSFFENQMQLNYDLLLRKAPNRNYEGCTFEAMSIVDCILSDDFNFKNCIFSRCSFNNVTFKISSIIGTGFLNCRFFNCEILTEETLSTMSDDNSACWFISCTQDPSMPDIIEAMTRDGADNVDASEDKSLTLETNILKELWPNKRRPVRVLLQRFHQLLHKRAVRAIASLERRGLILFKNGIFLINKDNISAVLPLLGTQEENPC